VSKAKCPYCGTEEQGCILPSIQQMGCGTWKARLGDEFVQSDGCKRICQLEQENANLREIARRVIGVNEILQDCASIHTSGTEAGAYCDLDQLADEAKEVLGESTKEAEQE